ncbi:MAG: adenylate kinase [Candidatus Cloacimonetes bacterium]|nr:adenylate kinase [Candidatus Cloacimonadota bacterium]MBS3766934.1 adenylate kinase [Candidatus Cloacimonadota bacterium]
MSSRKIVILLGPPGAGKGTQAKMVSEKLELPHISTGDILRNAIDAGTELGKKANKFMHKGELVPDEIVFDILKQRLQSADCYPGAVFDGFPRNKTQAKEFLELTYVNEASSIKAVLIDLDHEEVVKRLSNRRYCPNCNTVYNLINKKPDKKIDGDYICDKCGTKLIKRDDDKVDTIKNRLRVYEKSTAPIIDFFQKKSIFLTVDGDQNVQAVNQQIMELLNK